MLGPFKLVQKVEHESVHRETKSSIFLTGLNEQNIFFSPDTTLTADRTIVARGSVKFGNAAFRPLKLMQKVELDTVCRKPKTSIFLAGLNE